MLEIAIRNLLARMDNAAERLIRMQTRILALMAVIEVIRSEARIIAANRRSRPYVGD